MRIALLICLLVGRVSAQPLAAVGHPLPDSRLTAGTLVIRVVAGEITKPAIDVPVTVTVDGKSTIVKTDANGRAKVDGIAAGARVGVSLPSTAPELARSTFLMAETGGIRLFLSSAAWKATGAPLAMPSLRELSGRPRPDPQLPADALEVKLSYDDLADPTPPSGVTVMLVGFTSDDKVTVVAKPSDAKGAARFAGLDTTERTAYFAYALLPRNGVMDRLTSETIMVAGSGYRVVLSSHKRASKEPAIDPVPTAVGKGKLRVELAGVPAPGAAIEIVDAVTGKVIARGAAKGATTELDVAAKAGQLVYAQTTRGGETYRSRPQQVVSDRGGVLQVMVGPRTVESFALIATVEDDLLEVRMKINLSNTTWHPIRVGLEVPLATGFKELEFRDDDTPYVKATAKGFRLDAPLPPGGRSIILGFTLPIVDQRVRVAIDLPRGAVDSLIRVKADPGIAVVDLPATLSAKRLDRYVEVEGISIPPARSLEFAITTPKPDLKQRAIKKACKDLRPNLESPLLGKPLVDFTAPQLDGKPFTLSSLKGKLVFVTFNASFTHLRDDQKTLPPLVKQLGAELVTVLSDADPAEITKSFGSLPGRVVLDKPVGDANLGPITGRWNIMAVPETYVVDRKGVIKFHLVNQRDWSLPSTLACLKTGI